MPSLSDLLKPLEFLGKRAWAVAVLTGFIIFLPGDMADRLQLTVIRQSYGGWILVLFLFSALLTIGAVLGFLRTEFYPQWKADRATASKRAERKLAIFNHLHALNQNEFTWIACCVHDNIRTINAALDAATPNSLLNKHIVTRGSGSALHLPFHITDLAWECIQEQRGIFYMDNPEDVATLNASLVQFRRTYLR